MIRHFVLFNLNPEIEKADREWLFAQARNLSTIATVRRLALGKLLEPHEESYKQRMATDYGWCLSMEFDDENGLYVYQRDPSHVAFAQELRKRVSAIRVMDFVT